MEKDNKGDIAQVSFESPEAAEAAQMAVLNAGVQRLRAQQLDRADIKGFNKYVAGGIAYLLTGAAIDAGLRMQDTSMNDLSVISHLGVLSSCAIIAGVTVMNVKSTNTAVRDTINCFKTRFQDISNSVADAVCCIGG